jgi:hypothetical protein
LTESNKNKKFNKLKILSGAIRREIKVLKLREAPDH